MNPCKVDIFKFDIEQTNSLYNVTITDVISWNLMQIRATKQELEALVDFINASIDKEQKWKSQH
jgi:hypothetical protein